MTPTWPVPPGRSGNSPPLQGACPPVEGKEQAVAGARNSLRARTGLNGANRCRFSCQVVGQQGNADSHFHLPHSSAKEGEDLDFIQDGRIELDGELPLNTVGDSLGNGCIHGLWQIIEGALRASGRAGSRQVKDADVSFVGAGAPIVTATTFIFVREPY
jgi:hypothetical protein